MARSGTSSAKCGSWLNRISESRATPQPDLRKRRTGRAAQEWSWAALGWPAARRALEQQVALTCVARERGRPLELRTGLRQAVKLEEQISADSRQMMVAVKRGLGA